MRAALYQGELGLVDNWIHSIKDIYLKNQTAVDALETEALRINKLCEFNVIEQVISVCQTNIIQNAWRRGQALTVHGWIYSINDGILHDLNTSLSNADQLQPTYRL